MKMHTKKTDGLGSFAKAHFISKDGAADTLSLQQHQEIDSHHLYDTLAWPWRNWIQAVLNTPETCISTTPVNRANLEDVAMTDFEHGL